MALDFYHELMVPGLYLVLLAVAAWGFARFMGADPGEIIDTAIAEINEVREAKWRSARALNTLGVCAAFLLVLSVGRIFSLPAFGSSQHPSPTSPLAMDVLAGFTEVCAFLALFVLGVWMVTAKIAAEKRRLRPPAPSLPSIPLPRLNLGAAAKSAAARNVPGSGAWSRAAAKYAPAKRR
jgi:hypothetical protein